MFKKAPLRVLFSFVIVITFFPLEAAQKNTGMAGGEEFLGMWEYQETYTYEPMNYLKILKAGPGKFRLIEGVKGWYVNDKSRIKWYDQKEQYFDPPVIYLVNAH